MVEQKKESKSKESWIHRHKKILIAVIVIAIAIVTFNIMGSKHTNVELQTSNGRIVLELYSGEMPVTAGNFVKLVKEGFYDGIVFHRVIEGFMIQSGDPTGTGAGGPGYKIRDEFSGTDLDKNDRGTISMANAGPNTGGSQFFINLADNNFLNGKHPVFGRVIEGLDVVDEIGSVATDSQDRPVEEIKIISVRII